MSKILSFKFRGGWFEVNEQGQIKTNGLKIFSKNWIFLGGTKHHWSEYIQYSLKDAFNNPEVLNGCLGWDKDHGTLRQWRGYYFGKLPRITNTHIKNVKD